MSKPLVTSLLLFAVCSTARAQGVAPLVPIDESDAGAPTSPSAPTSPTAVPPATPLVPIAEPDAGPPPGDRLLAPQPADAGAPSVPLIFVSDAGAPPPEPVVAVDAGHPENPEGSRDAGLAPTDAPQQLANVSADGGAPPTDPNSGFVKGELSEYLGANRISVQSTRVGVGLGVSRISSVIYALVEPRFDLHLGDFGLGLAVPLNVELYDAHLDPNAPPGSVQFIGTRNAGTIRKEDYQSARDYARVLQYATYGRKEDHLYVDVGQIYAETLGHGELLRRYQPNIDLDVVRIAAEVDAYNDYVGMEAMTNDVLSANLVGLLGFVKPLSFFTDNAMARSFSVGVSYATDWKAPDALTLKDFPGSGLNGCNCRPVEDADGNLVTTTKAISLLGVDAELKVLKTEDLDIKTYADYSQLFGGDGGFTLGALGRFNFGGSPVTPTQAIRLVVEGRYLGDHYRPSYFDTFYEVDKFIYQGGGAPAQPTTQQQVVLQQGFGSRVGYYAEASYGIRKWVGVTAALEGDSASPAKNLILHAELPKLFIIQFFGSYYKRGFTNFSTLTDLDKNSIAFAGARLELLPILFLNGRAYQTFQLDSADTHTYQTTRGIEGDVELGWQF